MRLTRIYEQVYKKPWAVLPHTHASIRELLNKRLEGGEALDFPTEEESPLATTIGKVGIINVAGVILPKASLLERTCGAFSLAEFKTALAEFIKNPSIETIILYVDSPGGVVTGVPEAAQLVEQAGAQKNLVAFTDGQMCSAAYWIASQCGTLFATPSSDVGSIGVYAAVHDVSRAYENEGVKVELFKAGKHKAMGFPGLSLSEEEKAIIQAGVDKTYAQFVAAVTAKRQLPEDALQGLVYDGDEALELGLIDSLETDLESLVAFYNADNEQGDRTSQE